MSIDHLPIDAFCAEMRQLGAQINLPQVQVSLPRCNTENLGGFHIELSPDGKAYVFNYSEKGITDTLISSPNKDIVMERVFVEVTENAHEIRPDEPSVGPDDVRKMLTMSDHEIGKMAVDTQVKRAALQEKLLGMINQEWRRRQAEKNTARLAEIKKAFGV